MAISGVGNTYSYIYNSQTGKLSTKDGSKDEFVDYFNGDLTAEESTALNGFDAQRKKEIERLLWFSKSGMTKDIFDDSNGVEYEISGKIVDGATAEYSVNGQKVFTAYKAVQYTSDEITSMRMQWQLPYKTRQSKGYDPAANSINIAVGDVFDMENGYRFTVKDDYIYGEGFGSGSEEDDKKANQFIWALNNLIRFADQLGFAEGIDKESTPMILAFLRELGVDTGKEFTINGTKCEVVNGRIKEVGNRIGVPGSIYQKALARYEEWLYRPLSSRE